MITLNKYSDRPNRSYMELYGLSTDAKPIKKFDATVGGKTHIDGSFVEIEQSSILAVSKGFITDNNTIKFEFGEEVSVTHYPLTIYYR